MPHDEHCDGCPDCLTPTRVSDLDAYQKLAERTDGGNEFTKTELAKCCAMGLAGEAGEVVDLLKKHFYHGRPLDGQLLLKELGDVLWYLATLARLYGFPLSLVASSNIEKLRTRYPAGFSAAASAARVDVPEARP